MQTEPHQFAAASGRRERAIKAELVKKAAQVRPVDPSTHHLPFSEETSESENNSRRNQDFFNDIFEF